MYGPGHPTRVYSLTESLGNNFAAGSMQSTGNALDVAINGQGWFAVQAADGTEAYSRRGDLSINADSLLENGRGELILGTSGPISIPPAQRINIGEDGLITTSPFGHDNAKVVVGRLKMVDLDSKSLIQKEDGLFHTITGSPADASASVTLKSGMLETSNVNAVSELINLINLARQHELNIKSMTIAQDNDEASARLTQISG